MVFTTKKMNLQYEFLSDLNSCKCNMLTFVTERTLTVLYEFLPFYGEYIIYFDIDVIDVMVYIF